MKRTLAIVLLFVAVFILFGGSVVRNTLVDSTNKRLDSSEATLINEIDARIYKDFHLPTSPEEIELSKGSLQYRIHDNIVRIENDGEFIEMTVMYSDGATWSDSLRGGIEINEVDIVNINNQTKVDLSNTNSRLIAITYKFYEDFQDERVTMNRDFTRYLTISR